MVSAWLMDDSQDDQRLDHQRSPPEPIDLNQLEQLTGVLYWNINVDDVDNDSLLAQIRSDRGYSYMDEVTCSPDKLENYEQKLKAFFQEHLHTDEEIRLVLEGSGFFDIRDPNDKWIRIKVEKGDLIVLPAGSYHRFTLDVNVSENSTHFMSEFPFAQFANSYS